MSELTTKRTLVKSPPELWAEVSDLEALAKHLGEFGEIKITRLEPETTVVWEGDRVCGTVKLEPSGWGTKVTLTAELEAIEAVIEEEPEPVAVEEPVIEEEVVEEPVAVEPPSPSPIVDRPSKASGPACSRSASPRRRRPRPSRSRRRPSRHRCSPCRTPSRRRSRSPRARCRPRRSSTTTGPSRC